MERIRNIGLYGIRKHKEKWGKKYKDNRNWVDYNEQLVVRGEFYLDFDFVEDWNKELKDMNQNKVGRPFLFPDSFMKWQAVWHQFVDYRGLEGIARRLSKIGLIPEYDDYTTVWYRIHKLKPEIELPSYDNLDVGSDGSGLKSNNAGEYRVFKYGERTRKRYLVVVITADVKNKKLLNVDAHMEGEGDDEPIIAMKHVKKIRKKGKTIKGFFGDGKFDTNETFAELDRQKIEPKIPVHINATTSCGGPRRRQVRLQFGLPEGPGRRKFRDTEERRKWMQRKWRKKIKHGLRWPGTEGIFSAVKRKFGESIISRKKNNMIAEAIQRFWAYDTLCNYAIKKM